MPTVPRSNDVDVVPLSVAEQNRLDRALRRLHEAMRVFWTAWPIERRSASQLSRELEIDRTTCQRLSAIARVPFDRQSMLESMPGPRAMRMLIDAAGNAGEAPFNRATLEGLRAAVDHFDETLRQSAGSVSRLKRRLAVTSATTDGMQAEIDLDPQEALFHAARSVTGRHVRTIASLGLYDDINVKSDQLRHVRLTSNHGIVARPDAVPMVLESFDGVADETSTGWQHKPVLLERFTSADWTTTELQPSTGFASRAMEIKRSEHPCDTCIYTAFPVPHPRALDNPIEESWFILYSPAAMLVFDLYLHESIARQCLLSLDVHLWQTSFANAPHGKWHTRMPHAPTITQLGRGIDRAASPHHPRLVELTCELFARADVDPQHYVGFRCEEPYPMWRTGYRYELDFGNDA